MARRIGAAAYYNPEDVPNVPSSGMSLTPVQIGLGALALGGVGYLVYTNYFATSEEAPVEGIQQISLPSGEEVTVEPVSEEEVATPVVVPEVTKDEWTNLIRSYRDSVVQVEFGFKIENVAVIKKPTTFIPGPCPLSKVIVPPPFRQQRGWTNFLKVDVVYRSLHYKVYFLARPALRLFPLGEKLVATASSVKIGKNTQFVSVTTYMLGRPDFSEETLESVKDLIEKASESVPALKKLKSKATDFKVLSVVPLESDFVLRVDAKKQKGGGKGKGAKLFMAGDRVVELQGEVGKKTVLKPFSVVIAAADGKITPVYLEQPVTIKGGGSKSRASSGKPVPRSPSVGVKTTISRKPTLAMPNRLRQEQSLGDMGDIIPVKEDNDNALGLSTTTIVLITLASLGVAAYFNRDALGLE